MSRACVASSALKATSLEPEWFKSILWGDDTMTDQQHIRNLTPEAAAELLKELKRGPKPEPMDVSVRASEMTPAQRQAFIREAARRA